jgi:PAS domain S-box-containing protein
MNIHQEDRVQLALRAGKFGTWELDPHTRHLVASDQCKANFGRAPSDDFTYDDLYNSVHTDDRHKIPEALQHAMSGGREFSIEYRCIWPDASQHWIEVNGLVAFDASGSPEQVSGVTQEITDRKHVEAELAETRSKLTAMLDTVDVATWTVDLTTNILTADRNMSRMFFLGDEYSPSSIEHYFRKIHPDDLPKVKSAMDEVFAEPSKNYKIEYRLVGPAGEIRWIDVRGTVERNDEGKPVTFRGVILDITERKAAEELETRLTVSRRLLALQDQERRRIGRELHDSAGQILAALGMDIASIALEAKDNPAVVQHTEQCREMVTQLTQEIRTTSYLLHPPLLDELGLASALAWYVDGLNSRSGLKVTLSVVECCPRLESNLELNIFKVVQECLTNVYRHSGSATASVRVAVQPEKLEVQVSDQGKGMTAAKLLAVQAQASGVGMLGMRERIREVGGTMDITSNEQGTRISFVFPLTLALAQGLTLPPA